MFRQPRRPASAKTASALQLTPSQTERPQPLQDWIVACTGYTKDERDAAGKRVAELGGNLIVSMSSDTDVLIAAKTGSRKYEIAYELEIPVVKPEWLDKVEALWAAGHPFDAKKVFDDYRLGPFQGCSVCITGLGHDVRNIVETNVVQYGGRYTADLLKNQTTHLICDFGTGTKYKSAISWGGIKCVTINWFKDTIKTLERADENNYPPPTEGTMEAKVQSKSGSGTGTRDTTAQDELTLDPITFNPPSNMYMEACQIFLCPSFSPEQTQQYKKIIRLAGGIHIPEYDQREVTHVVVPSNKLAASTLALFSTHEELPYIVHQHWLRLSNREGKLVPESEHIVPFPTRTEDGQQKPIRMEGATTWTLDAAVTPKDKSRAVASTSTTATLRPRAPSKPTSTYGPSDVRSPNTDSLPSTPSDKTTGTLSPSSASPVRQKPGLQERTHSGLLTQALGDLSMVASTPFQITQEHSLTIRAADLYLAESDEDDKVKEEPVLNIFCGLYITTRGCNAKLEEFVRNETRACGGTYFDEDPPLVAKNKIRTVVPMKTKLEDTHGFPGIVVTSCWFERSVADERIIGCSDHFLFSPMKTFPLEGFSALFISASGLDLTEHTHFERAIKQLGGHFHKDLEKGVTNVLITDRASGPKFEHMVRSRLCVVQKAWLQRSIEEGVCLPFDDFLLVPTRQTGSQGSGDNDDATQQDMSVVPTQSGIPSATPLDGLTVCLPNRVVGNVDEMRALVKRLGAKLCTSYNSNVTHLIHHGKISPAVLKDVRAANNHGVCVVGPSWLYKSDETGLRAPELEHPEIYGTENMVYKDLRQSFASQSMPPPPTPTALSKRSQLSQSIPIMRQGSTSSPRVTPGRSIIGKPRAPLVKTRRTRSSTQQDVSQSLQGTSAEKLSVKFISEQTMTSMSSGSSLNGSRAMPDQDVSVPEPMEQDHQDYVDTTAIFQPAAYTPLPRDLSSRKRRRALEPSEDTSKADGSNVGSSDAPPEDEYYRASQDDEAKASKDVVHWVDTEGREKKRAFMAALGYKNTATLFAHPTDQPVGSRDHDDQDPGTQMRPTKYFLLSGISAEQRERCKKTIRLLGGVVLEEVTAKSEEWGRKCTHLLTNGDNPPKTAKMVIARARRASILTKSYMFACEEAGAYVDEEPYRVHY
ncbi:DNA topoisomerase 2-binding protein 1 [Mortierella sp. 14UC]|nr:DNA topoisomerase 2-binding protein 1 [Mortierella sp. 14UC]